MTTTRKKTLKLVILGDSGVGKTSLMNRFAHGKFTGQYKATIGADFISKDVVVSDVFGQRHYVTLQIWDTAGQERFQSLGVGFYRGSDAALLVYDLTDAASLDHLQHWQGEFVQHVGGGGGNNSMAVAMGAAPPFPFVVVGNKADKGMADRKVPPARAEEWCATHAVANHHHHPTSTSNRRPLPHFEASAKTDMNVEEVFQQVARLALQYEEFRKRSQPQLFVPPTTTSLALQPIDLRRQQSSMSQQGDACC